MEEDAKLFAEWEVDYVKLDGCYSDIFEMAEGKTAHETTILFANHFGQLRLSVKYSNIFYGHKPEGSSTLLGRDWKTFQF